MSAVPALPRQFPGVDGRHEGRDLELARLRHILADEVSDLTQVDEERRDVDQARRGVRAETRHLDTTALVRDGVHGIHEILVAGDEHRRVISPGEAEHIHGDLHIEVSLTRSVVEGLQFLLHDPKAVAAHPEQKTLLALCPGVDSRIKERAEEPAIPHQDAEQLVVIDVYVMKTRRVEEVVTIDEDGDTAAMAELPRRTGSRLELHCVDPKSIVCGREMQ